MFVDWISVAETLQHAATGKVRTVMLLHRDGSLISVGHATSEKTGLQVKDLSSSHQYIRAQGDNVTASLISAIWHDYKQFGGQQNELMTINVDFDNGQIAIATLGTSLLLCFVASHDIPAGMLRGKMLTVAQSLQELMQLYE